MRLLASDASGPPDSKPMVKQVVMRATSVLLILKKPCGGGGWAGRHGRCFPQRATDRGKAARRSASHCAHHHPAASFVAFRGSTNDTGTAQRSLVQARHDRHGHQHGQLFPGPEPFRQSHGVGHVLQWRPTVAMREESPRNTISFSTCIRLFRQAMMRVSASISEQSPTWFG